MPKKPQSGQQKIEPGPDSIIVWRAPRRDYRAWRELVAEDPGAAGDSPATWREYCAALDRMAAATLDRLGGRVEFIEIRVAHMRRELELRGLDNRPENRAAVAVRFAANPLEWVALEIRAARKAAGLSANAAAIGAGENQPNWHAWIERDPVKPASFAVLSRLAAAGGLAIDPPKVRRI